jgi:hypothetical protein
LEKLLSKWEIHSTAPNTQQTPMNQLAQGFPQHFTLQASNEHPLVPPASPMAPTRSNPGEGNQQPEANPTNFQEDLEAFHNL